MAQVLNTVHIIEVYKVAPPHGSAREMSLPLTFFDLLWLKLPPVQYLYFFKIPTPTPDLKTSFFLSVLPRLKHSLSLTLHNFLPLAGNIIWPQSSHKPLVKYIEGDVVSLTVGVSEADFNYLSGNNLCQAVECHPLIPKLAVSRERAAVFAVQVTLFPNCGFCIGIATHHALLDGRSFNSFIKAWSHVCKLDEQVSSLPLELKPFYDRSVMKYPSHLDEFYSKIYSDEPNNRSFMPWELQVPPNSFRGVFELTRANIEKLRQLVEQEQPIHMSSFSIACAYTWVCLVKAEEISEKKVILIFARDCRFRLEPPIPTTYIGNCLRATVAIAETKEIMGKEGFVVAVKAISEAIKAGLENGAINGAENEILSLVALQSEGKLYNIAGSNRFEFYKTDFGWGKPVKGDMASIDRTDGGIVVLDSRNGDGGVQIGIVSKKHHLEGFSYLFANGIQCV